eukprot:1140097-Pelagomonas_calceolata.AAC.4
MFTKPCIDACKPFEYGSGSRWACFVQAPSTADLKLVSTQWPQQLFARMRRGQSSASTRHMRLLPIQGERESRISRTQSMQACTWGLLPPCWCFQVWVHPSVPPHCSRWWAAWASPGLPCGCWWARKYHTGVPSAKSAHWMGRHRPSRCGIVGVDGKGGGQVAVSNYSKD